MKSLNTVYSSLSVRRRYEVWFLRMGLADSGGAWWFRYLLMNPGRNGCNPCLENRETWDTQGDSRGMPVQLWATWFPREGTPQSFIQGFPLKDVRLSGRDDPLAFAIGESQINENSCRGSVDAEGHRVSWDLRYHSTFGTTLSNKGWIGFSRTPHSDARFAGKIMLDGQRFEGDPLGFGVQGHNCGYRHRSFWRWTHAYFHRASGPPSTMEALVYDMPLKFVFRRAVLWHDGKPHVFRNLREFTGQDDFAWSFRCSVQGDLQLEAAVDGTGPSIHRLPYVRTDCWDAFEVVNNSLSKATARLKWPDGHVEELQTENGAVLEIVGWQR